MNDFLRAICRARNGMILNDNEMMNADDLYDVIVQSQRAGIEAVMTYDQIVTMMMCVYASHGLDWGDFN